MKKRNLLLNLSGLGVLLIASSGAMADPINNRVRFDDHSHHSGVKAAYVHDVHKARHSDSRTRTHEWRPRDRYRHMLRDQHRHARLHHGLSHRHASPRSAHYRWHKLQALKAQAAHAHRQDVRRWHKSPDPRLQASRDQRSDRDRQRNPRDG